MHRLVVIALLLPACDKVFDLHRDPEPADAPPLPIDVPPPPIAPCPDGIANSNHDEDGDGIDDACDNCPHVANMDQSESDGDDFGDVCDPMPGRTDCIAFFDGFPDFPGVATSQGLWDAQSDRLVQTEENTDGALFVFPQIDDPISTPYVTTRFHIDSYDESQVLIGHTAGLWVAINGANTDPAFPAGVITVVAYVPDDHKTVMRTQHINMMGEPDPRGSESFEPNILMSPGSTGTITVELTTQSELSARGTLGTSSVADYTGTFDTPRPAGQFGFRAVRAAVSFDYILVSRKVATPPCH